MSLNVTILLETCNRVCHHINRQM